MSTIETTTYQLKAVYEFRPLPGHLNGPVRRYAEGRWIEDDGEYDLAFVSGFGAPICQYFDPVYRPNIIAQWYDRHWSSREPRHPRGNAWHYALRPGTKAWGENWGRDQHENHRVSRKGMDFLCGQHGCANGRGISPTDLSDPHILAGLVRNRETGAVLVFPESPACMYCGDVYVPKNVLEAA